MEARQRVKLTGTNSSIGLITLILQCPLARDDGMKDQQLFEQRLRVSRVDSWSYDRFCASLAWWQLRGAKHPIPFRTRPLNSSAPMILRLKTRESRSLPGLPSAESLISHVLRTFSFTDLKKTPPFGAAFSFPLSGWRRDALLHRETGVAVPGDRQRRIDGKGRVEILQGLVEAAAR